MTRDKFFTINSDKLGLAKMSFFLGEDKNNKNKISVKKIIDFKKSEGEKINELETLWEENFVEFHHRILKLIPSNIELYDGSDWYNSRGQKAKDYYVYYLAVFLCHGVLVENFLLEKEEYKFTNEVFLPAFKKLESIFGIKPLIVPAIPENEIDNEYWWCYPGYLKDEIDFENKSKIA